MRSGRGGQAVNDVIELARCWYIGRLAGEPCHELGGCGERRGGTVVWFGAFVRVVVLCHGIVSPALFYRRLVKKRAASLCFEKSCVCIYIYTFPEEPGNPWIGSASLRPYFTPAAHTHQYRTVYCTLVHKQVFRAYCTLAAPWRSVQHVVLRLC